MRWFWAVVAVLGTVVGALGMVWFLQGSDLVHLEPVLCVAECQPVVGHQPTWQAAGAGAILAGAAVTTLAVRKWRVRAGAPT